MVSVELPGIGGEHLGSVTGQLEVKEDTFEEKMSEEERGGPTEELEEVVVREENPPKTVKIGSTLAPEHKAVLQKDFVTSLRLRNGYSTKYGEKARQRLDLVCGDYSSDFLAPSFQADLASGFCQTKRQRRRRSKRR
ncbi:hypothetical protein LWI29_009311 [Acer saccharum]|uniref:Uncharacterized protein n=1 Tax=Acer saccharum TaxID=4024 RepID=A0AA39SRP8_ACESA|nr:hypothetical protein LWI29_009311 [Acer saccharum]